MSPALTDLRSVPFVDRLASFGERPAVLTPSGVVSYASLASRVADRAAQLGTARRLVLLGGSNDLESVVTYLAALLGSHPTILVPGDSSAHLAALQAAYDPDVVFADGLLTELRPGTAHDLHPELALLLSTSGSTGSPKLVRLSARNLQSNAESIAEYLQIRPTDVAATTLPMHYCYGLSVVNSHLLSGAALLLTGLSVVDSCFWELFRKSGATTFAGVPYTFDLLDRVGFAEMSLPSLRYVTQAGGRLAPDTVSRYASLGRRRGWDLFVMYGQTEATARMAYLPPDLAETSPSCIGVPVPGGSLTLEPVPEVPLPRASGTVDVGELVYSGDNVMLGYAAGPSDLARGRDIQALRTGDVARRTPSGLFEVIGRRSRFAKVFGLRIDLDQVEQLLGEHGVVACCTERADRLVVGVEASAKPVDPGLVHEVARRELGLPAGAVQVLALSALPRLPSGKPDYLGIASRADAEHRHVRSLTPDSGHSSSSPPELAQLFGQVLNRPDVADSDTFVSLGGDSLSYVEMSIRLEERLGFLPADWHVTSVEELARKSKPPVGRPASPLRSDEQRTSGSEPARWRTLETNVVLRALAIVLIVGSHANLFMVLGGAHVLLGVAGFNFGRFRLTPAPRRERVRQLAASTARIVVPSVIWIGIASTFSGYSLTNVLLLNGVLGPRTWAEPEWYFWFVEALAYTLVAMTLLMGIPAVERLERKLPFWLPFSLAILGLLTRYDVLRLVDGDVIHRAHVLFWLFAIGWATAKSTYTWHRLLLSVLVVATVPGFFGDGGRDLVVIAGMLLLLWLRAVRVPSWAARPAGVLASASLYIYLCHWQVYPHWENTHPLFATVLSLVAGVALWKVAGVVTPYVDSGLTRVRRRGRTSPRKPLRSWRPGEPSDIGIGNNHGWLTPRRYAHVSLGKRHGVSPFPPVYARDRIAPRPVHGRVAMISLHTSPLDQPGTGDAGGMNVYVKELSKRLAQRNIGVEIYTRATSSELPPQVEAFPGVTVHHVHAGPFEGLSKDKLPSQLCVFAREVLRAEARHDLGWYDLVHSHYWLSGQVGALVRDRWSVPLAHSMHTMAKVKNESLALGDTPEPDARVIGEEQVVEAADMLVANTDIEARQLVDLYDADPTRVEVVHPGVDLSVFRPVGQARARRRLGLPEDAVVLLFAGRIQPLKAPDLLLHAVDVLLRRDPSLRRRLVVPVVGGPSGSGLDHPESLAQLAVSLGISDVVRFVPPVAQSTLVDWYAAATLVAVPSYNESFGLVAVEAQATGTPVVAAAVGGLTTVVRDGVSGLLVGGHDPHDYARAIERIVRQPALRASLSEGAVRHAADFAWERTADRAVEVYRMASTAMRLDLEELHA